MIRALFCANPVNSLHSGASGTFAEVMCEARSEFRCSGVLIQQYGSASLPKIYVHPGVGVELTITDFLSVFATIFLSFSPATLFPTSVLLCGS